MTNREIAHQLLRGKKKSHRVSNLRQATAVRVAGHRLGGVLTVRRQKRAFVLVKSEAKVTHLKKKRSSPARK